MGSLRVGVAEQEKNAERAPEVGKTSDYIFAGILLSRPGVSFRTYQLQIIYSDKLRKLAQEQYLKKFPLKAPRGIIYDRNLSELATNQKGYSVFARPEKITSPAQFARPEKITSPAQTSKKLRKSSSG